MHLLHIHMVMARITTFTFKEKFTLSQVEYTHTSVSFPFRASECSLYWLRCNSLHFSINYIQCLISVSLFKQSAVRRNFGGFFGLFHPDCLKWLYLPRQPNDGCLFADYVNAILGILKSFNLLHCWIMLEVSNDIFLQPLILSHGEAW